MGVDFVLFSNPRLTSTYAPFGQASIPDELPAEAAAEAGGLALSMAAGDFMEVYGAQEQEGQFDCVATCFFIDTAHNIIRYMEVLRHCLKVGSLVLATDLGGLSMGGDANPLLNWATAAMSTAAGCMRSMSILRLQPGRNALDCSGVERRKLCIAASSA